MTVTLARLSCGKLPIDALLDDCRGFLAQRFWLVTGIRPAAIALGIVASVMMLAVAMIAGRLGDYVRRERRRHQDACEAARLLQVDLPEARLPGFYLYAPLYNRLFVKHRQRFASTVLQPAYRHPRPAPGPRDDIARDRAYALLMQRYDLATTGKASARPMQTTPVAQAQ